MPAAHRTVWSTAWLCLLTPAAFALASPAVPTQIEDQPGTRFDRAPDDSFPNLKTLSNEDIGVSIRYRSDLAEVLESRPGMKHDDPARILRTLLAPGSPWYVFECSAGLSADPASDVVRENGADKHTRVAQLGGESFWVPGNGAVYSDGRANGFFPVRRKFVPKGDALMPVAQPFDTWACTARPNSGSGSPAAAVAARSWPTCPRELQCMCCSR